jgi:hypothetical protein
MVKKIPSKKINTRLPSEDDPSKKNNYMGKKYNNFVNSNVNSNVNASKETEKNADREN